MRITHLRASIFDGLDQLEQLHISQIPLKLIDVNCLSALNHLQSLLLEGMVNDVMDISNLTGSTLSKYLQIVSLRQNNFYKTINSKTFLGLVAVTSLYLTNSNIHTLGPDCFRSISSTVQLINLRQNALKTIPEHLFDNIVGKKFIAVHLAENPWLCDCTSVHLQNYLVKYPGNFADMENVICDEPEKFRGNMVNSTNFCDADPSDTGKTEETPHNVVNDSAIYPVINIKCSSIMVQLRRHHRFFRILMARRNLVLEWDSSLSDLAILVAHNDMRSQKLHQVVPSTKGVRCRKTTSKLALYNISIGMQDSYMFCLIFVKNPHIYPLDCLFYVSTKSKSSDQTNLILYALAASFGIALLGLVGGILLGLAIMLIRWRLGRKWISAEIERKDVPVDRKLSTTILNEFREKYLILCFRAIYKYLTSQNFINN